MASKISAVSDRRSKVSHRGLLHGGSGEDTGLVLDIAADHRRCADLTDHAPEAGHDSREQRQSRFTSNLVQASQPPAPRPSIWVRNSGSTC